MVILVILKWVESPSHLLGCRFEDRTFQLPGNVSLSIHELIIFTIGEVVSSAAGLMNFTGILSKPLEQSFLSSDVNLFISVNVVCFMTNAPSDSCSGIMVASFV